MIVSAARLFPVSSPPLTGGAVRITGGTIDEVGPATELCRRHPTARHRHFPGCVLLPGLVNAHTHLEYSALRHLARPGDFLQWIRKLVRISALRNTFWGKGYWKKSARRGIRQALAAGITSVGDVVTFGEAPEAAKEEGIRMRAYLEAVAVGAAGAARTAERLGTLVDRASSWPAHVTPGLSPHSIYTLSPSALSALGRLASERGLPLAIHAAETRHEKELLRGRGPLAGLIERWDLPFGPGFRGSLMGYFERHGVLTSRTLIVHGVHLDRDEVALAALRGAALATCPGSNALLGVGRADYGLWGRAGAPFSYGTDSLASVPRFDLFDEARRVSACWPEEAPDVLRRLTLGGAEAIGLGTVTGSLEPGKAADLVAMRLDDAESLTEKDLLERGSPERVAATMVGGRVLYTRAPSRPRRRNRGSRSR